MDNKKSDWLLTLYLLPQESENLEKGCQSAEVSSHPTAMKQDY